MSFALATVASLLMAAPVTPPGTSGTYDARWAASLAPNSQVELPAGTYQGPWKLAAGAHLTAAAGTVLRTGPGADATLTLAGDAQIEGLTIEVAPNGYGIRVGQGSVELTRLHLTAAQHAKAAVYVAHGQLVMRGGEIDGASDFGVLAEKAVRVSISGSSLRATHAGVATVFSPTDVEDCSLVGPFSEAAITLLNAPEAHLTGNILSAVKTIGIKLLNSTATLSQNRVTGARADAQGLEGNSLFAEDSSLTLSADRLGDPATRSEGAVIYLLHSKARLDGVQVQGGLQSLIYVAGKSVLTASNSELEGCPVGMAVEQGSVASEAGFRFVDIKRHVLPLPP